MALRVFPLDPTARVSFADTFGAPRPNGRTHEGTDVFAPEGTDVYAVDDGRVEFHPDEGIGGNVAYLHSKDRTRYVYSHLLGFVGQSRKVQAGELIGYVGKTGNAASTPPHLHFEVHPLEGGPVNPYPELMSSATGQPAPPVLPPEAPPAVPSSAPSQASALAFAGDLDGIALALLLYWGFKRFGRRGRTN